MNIQEADIRTSVANTFVDDATIHEKISIVLLVIFALRFYTYDHDVYLQY